MDILSLLLRNLWGWRRSRLNLLQLMSWYLNVGNCLHILLLLKLEASVLTHDVIITMWVITVNL